MRAGRIIDSIRTARQSLIRGQDTWVERTVVSLMILIFAPTLGLMFYHLMLLWCAFALFALFAFASKTRTGVGVCTVIAATLFGGAAYETCDANILNKRIEGTRFENTPLPAALHYLAKQRQSSPTVWFYIYEEALTNRLVTVELPPSCALGEALKKVCSAADCRYSYSWSRNCSGIPEPSRANFQVTTTKGRDFRRSDILVWIHRREIRYRQSHQSLATGLTNRRSSRRAPTN